MIVAVQLVQQDSQSSKLLSQWRVARSFRSGHSHKLTSIIVENSCYVMAPHPQHTHQAQEHGIHQLQGLSTQELTKSQHLSTLEDKCLQALRYPASATATVLFVHWTRCRSGQVLVCYSQPVVGNRWSTRFATSLFVREVWPCGDPWQTSARDGVLSGLLLQGLLRQQTSMARPASQHEPLQAQHFELSASAPCTCEPGRTFPDLLGSSPRCAPYTQRCGGQ